MELSLEIGRVWIVGSGASGKTTLASKLGRLYDLPVYDLDKVAYKNGLGGFGAKLEPLSKRLAWVSGISAKDRWVVEGIYLDWVKDVSERAEKIIWLDLPLNVILFRTVSRHIRRSLSGNNPYRGVFRLLLYLIWLTRYRYHKGTKYPDRNATAKVLACYTNKVIHCKSQTDVDHLLSEALI